MSSIKNSVLQNIATVLSNAQRKELDSIARNIVPMDIAAGGRPMDGLYARQILESDRTRVKQRISEIKSILTNSINRDALVKSGISLSNSKLAVTSNTYRLIETTLNGLSDGSKKQQILRHFQKANMENKKGLRKAAYNKMKSSNSNRNFSFLSNVEKKSLLAIRYLDRSLSGLIANSKGGKVSRGNMLKLRNKNQDRLKKIRDYRKKHYNIFDSILNTVVNSNIRRSYISTLVKESNNSMLREALKSKLGKSYMNKNANMIKFAIDIYKSIAVKPTINGKMSKKNVDDLISSFVDIN